MLRECSNEILGFLKETERSEEYKDIRCFIKQENKFNIHIFTCICEDENILKRKWKILNNDIAWYFEAKLKKEIERWNLYIIYFVKGEVDKNLQYEIEQDKYCSRKIVIRKFSRESNDDKLKNIINDKLFDIKIGTQDFSDSGKLDIIIEENEKYLFKLLKSGLDDDVILDNFLMGEKNEA